MSYPYIEVNNSGVYLLQQGNYAAAMPAFLLALDVFKRQVAVSAMEEFHGAAIDYRCNSSSAALPPPPASLYDCPSDQFPRDHSFFHSVSFRTDELDRKTATDRLHFHSRAFVLSERLEKDPTAKHRRDGTSGMILFNIGATLHAQAMRTGDSQVLRKALLVYKLAQSSAEEWALYSGGKRSLLLMSVVNNLALAHCQLMQVEESTTSLRLLRQLVIETDDLQPDDRSAIDWNVVLHSESRMEESPAPAA
ncbi:expressed unknown protein [Seminavis robusta]|uniref:Uncharacterized protein n=1 Tax=Seminavis robusta TaxID=568900 RepID=A0A9N8DA43_9STRA|nr:expressed unknown protein [Seminavis robusta]|eukprot:Sro13_g009820.1 n/a (250) ;mRNA; f:43168-43917